MNGKTLALSFSLILLVSGGSASIMDDLNDFWKNDAPEAHETVCESFAGWTFATCYPYKLDGGFVDGGADTVHNAIYTDSAFWKDGRETITLEMESNSNQTYGIGVSQAKMTFLDAYNNGAEKSEAHTNASQDIEDFYTQQQIRAYEWKNREVLKFNESLRKIEDTDGLTVNEVYQKNDVDGGCSGSGVDDRYFNVTQGDMTLYNGTEINTYGVDLIEVPSDTCKAGYELEIKVPVNLYNTGNPVYSKSVNGSETIEALNGQDYLDAMETIDDSRFRAIDNLQGIVDDIYMNLDRGEVEVGDMMGPLEATINAGLNYEDSGYYQYRALSLEQAGYASNDSYAFRLEVNNSDQEQFTATGQLFLEEDAYNGTIEKGKTYDASDTVAWFVHAVEDGKAKETTLNGTFTPLNMTDTETGEQINETTVQQTGMYTESTEDLEKQLEEIREDYEDLQSNTGIGGGVIGDTASWLNKVFPDMPDLNAEVLAVIGGLAAAVVLAIL